MVVTVSAMLCKEALENVTEASSVVIPTIWTIQVDSIKSMVMRLAIKIVLKMLW